LLSLKFLISIEEEKKRKPGKRIQHLDLPQPRKKRRKKYRFLHRQLMTITCHQKRKKNGEEKKVLLFFE